MILTNLCVQLSRSRVPTRYGSRGGKQVGESPENMPLNSHIFRTVVVELRHNYCRTYDIKPGDPNFAEKFRMGTPAQVESSLLRTWTSCAPTPQQIVRDVMKFPNTQRAIIRARGALVPELDNRSGRRRVPRAEHAPPHPDCATAEKATSLKYDLWIQEPVWKIHALS